MNTGVAPELLGCMYQWAKVALVYDILPHKLYGFCPNDMSAPMMHDGVQWSTIC